MTKKIYISEEKLSSLNDCNLLPNFLFKRLREHQTSLGDNAAFPPISDYPFDYMIVKKRYRDICNEAEQLGIIGLDTDEISTELSHRIKVCMDIERPIRSHLEKICENAINKLFAIPKETLIFDFKLVDKIEYTNGPRIMPESSNEATYTFDDINDISMSSLAIAKRRFINSLVLGASYWYSTDLELYEDDIYRLNDKLIPLYEEIRIMNDYLLFNVKEKISDDNPMQGAYVDTRLGGEMMKTSIEVQGIIFPLLLQEAIRGIFELFSSHGLPMNKNKAKYIVNKADYILAEPWDMRMGVELWKMIFSRINDTNIIPYMFTNLVKLPTNKFNSIMREILANTKKGKKILSIVKKNSQYDKGYQQFNNRINSKNIDKSIIQDSQS